MLIAKSSHNYSIKQEDLAVSFTFLYDTIICQAAPQHLIHLIQKKTDHTKFTLHHRFEELHEERVDVTSHRCEDEDSSPVPSISDYDPYADQFGEELTDPYSEPYTDPTTDHEDSRCDCLSRDSYSFAPSLSYQEDLHAV